MAGGSGSCASSNWRTEPCKRHSPGGRAAPYSFIYMVSAPAPAAAAQLLDAADHAELEASISATGVNRIAVLGDRIARVIRSPGGFETEHDHASGDLYLKPFDAEAAAGAPVTLFIGTEKGFTYRLALAATERGSAQILIRNTAVAAQEAAEPGETYVAALVRLVRAGAPPEPGAARAARGLRHRRSAPGACPGPRSCARHRDGRDLAGAAVRSPRRRDAGRWRCGRACRAVRGRRGGLARRTRRRSRGPAKSTGTGAARGGDDRTAKRGGHAMSARGAAPSGGAVDGDAQGVRRRQVLLFSAVAALALVVLALWLAAGGGGERAAGPHIEAELAGPDTAEEAWTRRSEARMGTIETRIREMETEARQLRAENERLRERLNLDAADARRGGGDRPPAPEDIRCPAKLCAMYLRPPTPYREGA